MTGILNIDKPEGASSAWVVNRVKRLTGQPCGHFGTLDPFASGVLPVGIGNATRLFDYFLGKRKSYRARFRFGATTDTLDPEGTLTFGGEIPSEEDILSALPSLRGNILQVPPVYSAKSVGGDRSYKLAREGKTPELPAKQVAVYAFELEKRTGEDEFEFTITCGAGTYIRALARDLAFALGTLGYCTFLRRTAAGIFTEETAVSPETLDMGWANYVIPTDEALPFPSLEVDDPRFYNGVKYRIGAEDGTYKIYRASEFYGTGIVEGGVLRSDKKLC